MYKVNSSGYFGGVAKVSRGPWFRDFWVEDDGLEWYYTFYDNDGKECHLLSNNVPIADRERIDAMYKTQVRNSRIGWAGGLWLGFESATRFRYFKTVALGWKFTNTLAFTYLYHSLWMDYTSQVHAPIMGAFLRKYHDKIQRDLFDIKDEKREYYYIDTSEYMNYSNATLSDEYHAHHGPQPEGEVLDSSWLSEVDKFLKGEENNLKGHKRFLDYNFQFIDKSFPTEEAVANVMHRTD